jgi:hypothetical protein
MSQTQVQKGCRWIKLGAWGLVVAGFGHAVITIPDLFLSGMFSPVAGNARLLMQEVSVNIVALAGGKGTSLFESMWGAYLGFNISHGLGVGFFGLIHLVLAGRDGEVFVRVKSILPISIAMSAILLVTSVSFWFYLPTLIVLWNLICLVAAWSCFNQVEKTG